MPNKQTIAVSMYGNVVVQVNDILTPELAIAFADKLRDTAMQALIADRRDRARYVKERGNI